MLAMGTSNLLNIGQDIRAGVREDLRAAPTPLSARADWKKPTEGDKLHQQKAADKRARKMAKRLNK